MKHCPTYLQIVNIFHLGTVIWFQAILNILIALQNAVTLNQLFEHLVEESQTCQSSIF